MTVSPQWATWSLRTEPKGSKQQQQQQQQRGQLREAIDEGDNGKDKDAASSSTSKRAVALFAQSSRDNIDTSEWQEIDDDGEDQHTAAAATSSKSTSGGVIKQEAIDVDDLFDEVQAATCTIQSSSALSSSSSLKRTDDKPLIESGYYRFDPLSPVESRELSRLLKLSKYIPPSAEDLKEERRLISSAKKKKTVDVDEGDDNDDEADDDKRRRRVGNRINAETGKRIYKVGARATGLIQKENKEAKDVLQSMCKNHLPRRHFDWILAQLTFHKVNMLGSSIDEVPSSRMLLREEAVESIRNETMEAENLAHVIRLLAEASKLDVSKYSSEIVDPTKSARNRGKPIYSVRNEMTLQSKAIFDVIKFKLFPDLFAKAQEGDGGACSVDKDGVAVEIKVDGGTLSKSEQRSVDGADPSSSSSSSSTKKGKEVSQTCGHQASWNTIFPTLRAAPPRTAQGKEETGDTNSPANDAMEPTVDSVQRKRKAVLDDSTNEGNLPKKLCKTASPNVVDTDLTVGENRDDVSAPAPAPAPPASKLPQERTTRKSKGNSDGDFKLPLPPFWSKKKA